ncbi:hypothetical protein EUGRSUZ_E01681 [Eucalyptus grandis]|uniref:Uncharacterized protein n=2 Tax=Eucalyptus grandis TaxID=71139 RepID=A0ACC3KVT0_EUCGR|nr:hypothetical protein EUGRSUZ_E01681 [Eucalyptus grandis]
MICSSFFSAVHFFEKSRNSASLKNLFNHGFLALSHLAPRSFLAFSFADAWLLLQSSCFLFFCGCRLLRDMPKSLAFRPLTFNEVVALTTGSESDCTCFPYLFSSILLSTPETLLQEVDFPWL